MIRRALGAALALVASVGLATMVASPASAHNTVVATSPTEKSVVSEQPGSVSLTTSDELIDIGGSTVMRVVGPDGRHFETACATVDGVTAEVSAELGQAGRYTVEWQVVSADGHPISGEFAFHWAPAEGEALAAGSDHPACGDATEESPRGEAESSGSASAASVALGDVLWIGGGVLVVIAAALGTWLVVRRRA
ncbi:copper resistance CopC family protein [Agromyces sp. Marseille-P2726]|uniref:copper resistance CopC family protein n=1 Tax=Agromyces sp. Marseille-P2726 TaxID=2709132 RepID=UPI00156E219A|nr:copper resistance CopC family protein [Agromyces sp. Marseille-P2726]